MSPHESAAKYTEQYRRRIDCLLADIDENEGEAIARAGRALAASLEAGGLLYVFGCGHSHMVEEELFYRAGGLAPVCPVFDTATMLHEGAAKSSRVERMDNYAELVFARYAPTRRDCFLLASTSGINPLVTDMALLAHEAGATVIGISSGAYREKPSRRADGLHLADACDICVDNHVPLGDACVEVCSDGTKAGPLSSIATLTIANMITLAACDELRARGVEPRVFRSGNCEGAEDHNAALVREFSARVRSL